MKLLSFILSITILFISTESCSDGIENHQDEMSDNHNHNEQSNDSCPFACACNCCGISITFEPLEVFNLNLYSKISTEVITSFESNYSLNFSSKIWQPPQVIS